jgi:hypothetical protein
MKMNKEFLASQGYSRHFSVKWLDAFNCRGSSERLQKIRDLQRNNGLMPLEPNLSPTLANQTSFLHPLLLHINSP